jgi:hypothetical protein
MERELIDLSAHYNRALSAPLHNNMFPSNDFASLPTGRQVFAGVPWDVRGLIEVASRRTMAESPDIPERVTGIKIGLRCARLNFLHSCGWGGTSTKPMGAYVVHYADGQSLDVPIVHGKDLLDWWNKPKDGATEPVVAWSGRNGLSRSRGATIQLFKTTWTNPRPEVEIATVDFVSGMVNAAPFLVAITAER